MPKFTKLLRLAVKRGQVESLELLLSVCDSSWHVQDVDKVSAVADIVPLCVSSQKNCSAERLHTFTHRMRK